MARSYWFEDNLAESREIFIKYSPAARNFPKGYILSAQGTVPKYMFFLLEGMVKVYTNNYAGYERILAYHRKNTLTVLEDSLFSGAPAVVTIESVTDIRALQITPEILKNIMIAHPELSFEILKYYCKVLCLLSYDAENQSINNATIRMANFLYLYMQSQEYKDKGVIYLTQENLASAINASRVHTSRICAKLKEKGIISTSRGKITILDKKKLVSLCRL
ncbi:MAG TPA: Crp/Fnr family transcriptional regulator [Firmicutes bacterium]|nr:Crp/Fnr family transcriptional regulator [Bacillota bacterium]